MRRGKKSSDGRDKAGATRGVAVAGRLTVPVTGLGPEARDSNPEVPQSAPMPASPLPQQVLERLKERAKSSPLPKGAGSQVDPATRK